MITPATQAPPVSISWDWIAPTVILCLIGAVGYFYRELKKARQDTANAAIATVAVGLKDLGTTLGARMDALGTDFRETVKEIFAKVNTHGEDIREANIRCHERTSDINRRFDSMDKRFDENEKRNEEQHKDIINRLKGKGGL